MQQKHTSVAQERVEHHPDGLARITLKNAYTDGTIAVDMDSLSLLCRLATSVPPPRLHTIRYAGSAGPGEPVKVASRPQSPEAAVASDEPGRPKHAAGYRPGCGLTGEPLLYYSGSSTMEHRVVMAIALEQHSVDVPWWTDLVVCEKPIFRKGFAVASEKPGLGIELNEDV